MTFIVLLANKRIIYAFSIYFDIFCDFSKTLVTIKIQFFKLLKLLKLFFNLV